MKKNTRIALFILAGALIGVFMIPLLRDGVKKSSTGTPNPRASQNEKTNSNADDTMKTYLELRDQVFKTNPQEFKFKQTKENPNVWGVVVDIGTPLGPTTMVSLTDGTTSLYTGSGGGIIGGGGNTDILNATQNLVLTSEDFYKHMKKTANFPLPKVGFINFYILTYDGIYLENADENDLSTGMHKLTGLYHKVQEVLTQLRLADEKKEAKPEGAEPQPSDEIKP